MAYKMEQAPAALAGDWGPESNGIYWRASHSVVIVTAGVEI